MTTTDKIDFHLVAYHLEERISLFNHSVFEDFNILKKEKEFILLEGDENKWLYIKSYGSIVFCGYNNAERKAILIKFSSTFKETTQLPSEKFVVSFGKKNKFLVGINSIHCPYFSIDFLHIIMFNLGQTVGLDFYQNKVNELLEKINDIATQLEVSGEVKTSRKKLRQFVGKAMGVKNKMAENLYIFETSDLAWSNGELAELDSLLRTELEVVTRHEGIQHNIDTVKENLDVFIQILDHKHSIMLEWIIIILIAVEIVQLLIERL